MIKKAEKVIKDLEKQNDEMIENVDEMIPKKRGGPLDVNVAMTKTVGETKKIMGVIHGEAIPNKFLKRLKDITKET